MVTGGKTNVESAFFSFQPCMTKTEKSGIVLRNCATISKREEMCEEEDEDGATLCYCLTGMEYEP